MRAERASAAAALALGLLLGAPGGPAAGGEANPPLPRTNLTIGGRVRLRVEVARTERERELGLSHRPGLREGEGMLFLFGGVGPAGIWMKDMRFPLDILWVREGRIVRIVERAQPLRPGAPPEIFTALAEAVLEVPAGFAASRGLVVGDPVQWDGPEAPRARP